MQFNDLPDFIVNLPITAIPGTAFDRATYAVADCVGCALAGSREGLAGKLLKVIPSIPGSDASAAPMAGTTRYATHADAALYNGTVAHALDFDDVSHPAYAHPSAVLVPALLSLAAVANASGRELLAAYIVGFEVFGRLGRALNTEHYANGWHPTSTFGSLAAAAAAARLLRLNERQASYAVGIASSAASGLRANFGTETKPLHCGYAARNGVLAALLAREDFTANEKILTTKAGFTHTFNQTATPANEHLQTWGMPEFEILSEFGLALKLFPSCGATHPAIEAALLLHQDLAGRIDHIKAVRVGIPAMAFQPLKYVQPTSPLEGKFSMHFVVAAALVDGNVALDTFTNERIADPGIQDLIGKIHMEADERVAHSSEFAAIVNVETIDGSRHEQSVPLAVGKPERWFSESQLAAKFMDCASIAMPIAQGDRLLEQLLQLPHLPSLGKILKGLRVTEC